MDCRGWGLIRVQLLQLLHFLLYVIIILQKLYVIRRKETDVTTRVSSGPPVGQCLFNVLNNVTDVECDFRFIRFHKKVNKRLRVSDSMGNASYQQRKNKSPRRVPWHHERQAWLPQRSSVSWEAQAGLSAKRRMMWKLASAWEAK